MCSPAPVLVSFVLRLRSDHLARGRLVGEVEDVESGAVHPLRGTAELVAFCQAVTGSRSSGGRRPLREEHK